MGEGDEHVEESEVKKVKNDDTGSVAVEKAKQQ